MERMPWELEDRGIEPPKSQGAAFLDSLQSEAVLDLGFQPLPGP